MKKPMKKLMVAAVAAMALSTAFARAANYYYASPDGKTEAEGGAGTLANPYDLETGLQKACGWYDELRLLSGTYKLTHEIDAIASTKYIGWDGETDQPATDRRGVVIDGQNLYQGFISANLRSGTTIANMTISNILGNAIYFQNTGASYVTNCVITDVHGHGLVGNGYRVNDSWLTCADCDFTAISHNNTQIAGQFSNGNVILRNCRFYDNHQTEYQNASGSLFNIAYSKVYDCVFSNNTAVGRGGVAYGHTTDFRNCIFEANTNSNCGGCYYTEDEKVTHFYDCTFRNNCAPDGGCFVSGTVSGYSRGGVIWATNCTFVGNATYQEIHPTGGYLYRGRGAVHYYTSTGTDDKEDPTVGRTNCYFDCTFATNIAAGAGGVFHADDKWPLHGAHFERCAFNGNASTNSNAGAICSQYTGGGSCNAFCNVTNCTFVGNRAKSSGGVIYTTGPLTVTDSSFVTNECRGVGSVIAGENHKRLTVTRCAFTNNFARSGYHGNSGVIATWKGTYGLTNIITDCTFVTNTFLTQCGGVYYTDSGRNVISNCLFEGNSPTDCYGGNIRGGACIGAFVQNNGYHMSFEIDNCIFRGSKCNFSGAAIALLQNSSKPGTLEPSHVRNCLFADNEITGYDSLGAAIITEPGLEIESCTFVNNKSYRGAAAVYLRGTDWGGGFVRNCYFAPGCAGNAFKAENITDFSHVTYCCGIGDAIAAGGKGNVPLASDADPKFVDAAAGDYRPAKDSPCVNAGENASWMQQAKDLQRSPRIPRILYNTVDIGCYEYRALPGLMLLVQ